MVYASCSACLCTTAPLLRLCCTFAAPLLHLCCTFAAPLHLCVGVTKARRRRWCKTTQVAAPHYRSLSMTNTVSRYAASNALATTPRLDVNLIAVTLIICTTIVALAWIMTRHCPSNDDTDKVLCFLSLGKSKSSHFADRINRGLAPCSVASLSLVLPSYINGVNNVKLVSSCGGPILP